MNATDTQLIATEDFGNIFVAAPAHAHCTKFEVYRHAGDADNGNLDSWFIVATVRTPVVKTCAASASYVPKEVECRYTHDSQEQHGVSSEMIGRCITRMITHGLNMDNWSRI